MRILKRSIAALLLLALACTMLSCASCKMEKPVATCAGYEILYEEVRYLTLKQKDVMRAKYGNDIFDTEESAELYRAELEAEVSKMLKESYAVLAACNHYLPNLKIDDDSIEQKADEYYEALSEEEIAALEDNYMTEHFIRFNMSVAAMKERLVEALAEQGVFPSDDHWQDFMTWIRSGNGAYVQHLFIRNDEGESVEENRALAQSVRAQLISGTITPFEAIGSATYNQDPFNTTPYYVIRDNDYDGVNDPACEAAALALSTEPTGTISEIAETEDGFYIFIREADTDAFLSARISTLLDEYQKSRTEQIIRSFVDDLVIEWNDYGRDLDLLEIE